MSIRTFVDARGVTWRVWCTIPSSNTKLQAPFASGWLTFESADVCRRLAPFPEHWRTLTDARLARLVEKAADAPRRTTPISQPAAAQRPDA